MNSTSGAWQLATSVSRELRVEPGGSTGLYVWLSFSFLLLVVFLVLALSFARHTRRVLRRRRVLLDYAEANITIIRPRIHRMFTSRAGSRVTAWPDLHPAPESRPTAGQTPSPTISGVARSTNGRAPKVVGAHRLACPREALTETGQPQAEFSGRTGQTAAPSAAISS